MLKEDGKKDPRNISELYSLFKKDMEKILNSQNNMQISQNNMQTLLNNMLKMIELQAKEIEEIKKEKKKEISTLNKKRRIIKKRNREKPENDSTKNDLEESAGNKAKKNK